MRETKQSQLQFSFGGKHYKANLISSRYTEKLMVSKLLIGNIRCWVIFQNGVWRFIGDMPLCSELKNMLAEKILAFHEMPAIDMAVKLAAEEPVRASVLLNQVLNVLALKSKPLNF